MTGRATITFSQPGVQGPVYVVTSVSSPPWQPLELNPTADKTAAGDTIYSRQFDNVSDGTYQYKIRLGQDHWIVDESMETATDDVGNRNNVVHVKSEVQPKKTASTSEAASTEDSSRDEESRDLLTSQYLTSGHTECSGPHEDTAMDVVDQVDKEQHAAGTVDTESLPKEPKRGAPEADAKSDFKGKKPANPSPKEVLEQNPTSVPLVVVEKTDDTLSHGDDFGENASSAQRLAHELRMSDATPDRIVIEHDHCEVPNTLEEQAAPQFSHESFESDSQKPSIGSPSKTIEEELTNSSRNKADTKGGMKASSAIDEPLRGSVNTAKSAPTNRDDERNRKPWLSLETGSSGQEVSELSHSPLMSHESSYTVGSDVPSADELDQSPLLPHEMDGPRQSTASLRHRLRLEDENERHDNKKMLESMRTLTFSHEGPPLKEDVEAPLLPHERDSITQISHGPEVSAYEAIVAEGDHRRLSSEGPSAARLSSISHPSYFRTRTSSSSLPHRLPQSDEEDENLHDPSLELFPTSRDQILEQVVAIGKSLPEDEPHGTSMHSPHMTAMSQACSSIDLAPVKSYTSLQSVEEESIEEGISDPPSPVFDASSKDKAVPQHADTPSHDNSRDTPLPTDGIATPSKVLDPPTPPLTPEKRNATVVPKFSASGQQDTHQENSASSDNKKHNVTSSAASQSSSDNKKGGRFRSIVGAVCNPFGRLWSVCFGDHSRKQTTGAVIIIGIAMAAYYVYVIPGKTKSVGHSERYVRA